MKNTSLPPLKMFVSYAHRDGDYFTILSEGLKTSALNSTKYQWQIWDDTQIHIGTFWDTKIQEQINNCDVALLLVSGNFMASKYIKDVEFKKLIERYAQEGILIVPVMFGPCDFGKWEELSLRQFFYPRGKEYGESHIADFTYSDLIKFSQKDGTYIPNSQVERYHLNLFRKIEDSAEEFTTSKNSKPAPIEKEKSNAKIPLSDYPKTTVLFTGREKDKLDFKDKFQNTRLFAIEGLGGQGKTQFAAKCIEDFINIGKVIWLDGSTQSRFDVFVQSAGYGDVLKGENKSDLSLFSGFKDLIERDERVLFFDNFHDYTDPTFTNFLSFAYPFLKKSTIIIITKTEPVIPNISSLSVIKLGGLEDEGIEYALKLKKSNFKFASISDQELAKTCKHVEGHPLAIELSMQLMSYGKSADDLIEHMAEYKGIRRIEEFNKRFFLDIFNHPNTIEEERECFLKFSVFKDKVPEDAVKYLNDGKEIFHLLTGLIDKLLITAKESYYETHPLIRTFAYELLSDKRTTHKKAAHYFITQRNSRELNPLLEEKIFYHLAESKEWDTIRTYVVQNGRSLIHQGQFSLLKEQILKLKDEKYSEPLFEIFLGDISQIKGEWDEAVRHFENASTNTVDERLKVEGIIKKGEIFLRRGNLHDSLELFEMAYKCAKQSNFESQEARALNDIGLVLFKKGNLKDAYAKLTLALKIRENLDNKEDIGCTLINLGLYYVEKKLHVKAKEFYTKCKEIFEEIGSKNYLATTIGNTAMALHGENKVDEALVKCKEALKISEEIGDKEGISTSLNNMGLILSDKGQKEEALACYEKSFKLHVELNDLESQAVYYNNVSIIHAQKRNYSLALDCLLKSVAIHNKIGGHLHSRDSLGIINKIRSAISFSDFKTFMNNAFNSLSPELKENVQLNDLLKEPIRKDKTIGRNDPCPCGNGKKYKNCHGKG